MASVAQLLRRVWRWLTDRPNYADGGPTSGFGVGSGGSGGDDGGGGGGGGGDGGGGG